jgi:hypothetical protein
VGSEQEAIQKYYTFKRVVGQAAWRKNAKPKTPRTVCEAFCKKFDAGACPHQCIPPGKKGDCPDFSIKAGDIVEAQALLVQDAQNYGVKLGHIAR